MRKLRLRTKISPLWQQLLLVGLTVSVGSMYYQFSIRPLQNAGPLSLQRIDLLYLNEPAPALQELGGAGKRVIVFCENCSAPRIAGAQVIRSSSKTIAQQYALVTPDGAVGPGYAIIDSQGFVRYRTFDSRVNENSWEINRIVRRLP